MDALVSYSDEEVEDRKPSKRIKTEPHEDVTVALSRAEITKVPPKAGPGASLLPKREVHSPSIPSRVGSTSSTPLVVRQHRPPVDNPKETKTLPRAPEAVQAGSSKDRFILPALTGVSADRSPLASWKGKERARDEEDSAMTPAELEAAYRRLVRPEPNRSGDPEWGLPMVPREGADPKLEGKLANFHTLKTEGTHFNTSLMRSHAFHNPHIYAKLVSFVDIEETGSNYPAMTSPGAWNPYDPELLRTGDAHTIAEEQKRLAEAKQAAQAPGKRSQIAFTSSSSKSASSKEPQRSRTTSSRDHARDRDSHRDSHRERVSTGAKDADRLRKRLLPHR